MIVLVAGGTGFLGKRVVHFLRKEGHETIVYHRSRRAVPTYVDAIVNCVGIIREGNQSFEEAHVDVTRFLVGLGKKLKVRQFVQVSAIGASLEGTPYQRTKARAERIVAQSGLPYAIIRPSIMFGPGDRSISRFRKIARTGFFPLLANGTVQPVHVDTVARTVVAALNRRVRNRAAEVAGPEVFTYAELADRLHPGVNVVRLPRWMVRLITMLGSFIPFFPTAEMVEMMRQDNTTNDRLVKRLKLENPKVA